jgi:hypothetical protein
MRGTQREQSMKLLMDFTCLLDIRCALGESPVLDDRRKLLFFVDVTTIVHNWALASLAFAQSLDDRPSMLAILEEAAKVAPLNEGIELARATLQATSDHEKPDPNRIRSEGRATFYRALGSRLVALQATTEAVHRRTLLQSLLDQCLKLGPRAIDAAVLILASSDGLSPGSKVDYSDYEKRLARDRELRITLMPMLINLLKRTS